MFWGFGYYVMLRAFVYKSLYAWMLSFILGRQTPRSGIAGSYCKFIFIKKIDIRCCGLNVCVPPKSKVEILAPKLLILWDGAFGRWLGHEGGALMNGIGALRKEIQESSIPLRPCEDTLRRGLWTSTWALNRHWICQHLDIGLPGLLNRDKFLLFIGHPASLWCSVTCSWEYH